MCKDLGIMPRDVPQELVQLVTVCEPANVPHLTKGQASSLVNYLQDSLMHPENSVRHSRHGI